MKIERAPVIVGLAFSTLAPSPRRIGRINFRRWCIFSKRTCCVVVLKRRALPWKPWSTSASAIFRRSIEPMVTSFSRSHGAETDCLASEKKAWLTGYKPKVIPEREGDGSGSDSSPLHFSEQRWPVGGGNGRDQTLCNSRGNRRPGAPSGPRPRYACELELPLRADRGAWGVDLPGCRLWRRRCDPGIGPQGCAAWDRRWFGHRRGHARDCARGSTATRTHQRGVRSFGHPRRFPCW